MARSSIAGDTGHGATISFASGITETLKVRSIDPAEVSISTLDASHLGTQTYRDMIHADLADPPELSLEYVFDTFDADIAPGTDLGSCVVTFPLRTGEATPANMTGSAFVVAVKKPRLETDVVQMGSLRIQFRSNPTWTKST
jgi:hypothetical protein